MKVQAALQKYLDSAISKCVAKGTLIPTDKGLQYIEELVTNRKSDTFEDAEGYREIVNMNGEPEAIAGLYYNGVKPGKRITLSNGIQIITTPTHKLMTEVGWVAAQDLQIGTQLNLKAPTNYIWKNQEEQKNRS